MNEGLIGLIIVGSIFICTIGYFIYNYEKEK